MRLVLPEPQIDRNTTAIYAIGETHPMNLVSELVEILLLEARQLPKHAKEECRNSLDSRVRMYNLDLLIRRHTGGRMDTDISVRKDEVRMYLDELIKFVQRRDITEITRNKMLGYMQMLWNMVSIEQELIEFVQPNTIYHEGFADDINFFLAPKVSCVPLDKNAKTEYEILPLYYHFLDGSVEGIESRREGLWFEAIKESPPTGPCLLIAGADHLSASTEPDITGIGTLPRRIKEAGIKFELLFDAATSPYTRLPG